MKPANSLMSGLGTTVFEVMSALAREHQSVNLGQGFPDDKGPEAVRAAAADYLMNGHNQYPPMMGIPELRQAVAEHAKRFQGLDVDWQTEVLVTSGATEALGDCLFGLIEPGDEVVLIEPLYDSYLPIVRRAGGIAQAGAARTADLAAAARRAGRRVQRSHQAHPVQHADEPLLEGIRSRGTGVHRRALPQARRLCRVRRGLRAHHLRRPAASVDHDPAGNARAHRAHRFGRQELQPDRLEGGLRHGVLRS